MARNCWFGSRIVVPEAEVLDWVDQLVDLEAVDSAVDGAGITVAVLDTGVDRWHADLRVAAAADTTGDVIGADVVDAYGHGTFVAGVLASLRNQQGVLGVCPAARLVAIRVGHVDESAGRYANDVVAGLERGIIWAIEQRADVLNLSLEFESLDPTQRQRLDQSLETAISSGIALVAATGNGGVGHAAYPASSRRVLGVGAVGHVRHGAPGLVRQWDREAQIYVPWFSNYGPGLDLVAPGVEIVSTVPVAAGSYRVAKGTSVAAPFAAGACALILHVGRSVRRRTRSYVESVYEMLRRSARPIPGIARQFQGNGLLNIGDALRVMRESV